MARGSRDLWVAHHDTKSVEALPRIAHELMHGAERLGTAQHLELPYRAVAPLDMLMIALDPLLFRLAGAMARHAARRVAG